MAENTKIEWTDHTFNPWIGCTKVGPGCDHCYAENLMDKRMGVAAWGPGKERVRTKAANWKMPLRWNAQAEAFMAQHGRRQRVFCASLADVFDNAVDPQWREDLFELIRATPNLDWLLLTKRIGNAAAMIQAALDNMDIGYSVPFAAWPWPNVWIGATVVNQEEAERDIPKLLQVPARVRFLSVEPLLGPVDLTHIDVWGGDAEIYPLKGTTDCVDDEGAPADDVPALDWVIVGGESGPGARPMHPDWARSLRDQCEAAGVPFLFKQWGEWLPAKEGRSITGRTLVLEGSAPFTDHPQWHGFEDGQQIARVGKKAAGRLLDGRAWDGFPAP
ncbi:phage Gp37/Gp68 family protein [Acidovorax sp. sif1233]|uniref:phage Gp37/Gp68 family protein n=1 Tax=Acidovorax sp. sif1233 TaxID=2854792 RepID=UPI001C469FA6|nr:phage Gp37/Gp68 family protein [Acidovorax sp. sif1233]MBV7457365.1 phage Gp37/Gp68 family protein [Acidovorax sp. sif1233]